MAYTIFNFTDSCISIAGPHCEVNLIIVSVEHRIEAVRKDSILHPQQHTLKVGQVPGLTLMERQNAADYPLRQQILYGLIVCGPLSTKQAIEEPDL